MIQSLCGRNDDGSFKTAVGKEYPTALCRVVAHSFGRFALDAEHSAIQDFAAQEKFASNFELLVKPFVIAINDSPYDFGADFVDGGVLPLLQLPKL